jgi:hypothetical protein
MENLDLIDWRMVGSAALWITGLAVILASFGFADYHARGDGVSLREMLRRRGYQISINVALVLFCAGLMVSAGAWWEAVLWGLLACAFAYFTVQAVRAADNEEREQ